ncbi:uncharacterized protein L3040_005501 [Drepanopeziza brunnea f. sp. 'multigermtubi']|uniref:FAD dependent oxidoreductase n=1 Tax=Marssonina brunnea f. sp. multigermtubi (strain MB_m1) TaxID=1072389 RepID=K1WLX4_MARBU|nr:FAD dependent oxidoreductase [Drepanopeziza brunnea f. sp. 'multigermtubi' MB_m1]EKD13886.1 FAD dependent oxidoreductase [Drepanopeziza brunnea f. sp. 'multigermtubi' MB_m1]KAJ5040942.1 hypothetical protein L3040_005501 [Drepanopeziza brunnea f. sp. 'multigermtubi']
MDPQTLHTGSVTQETIAQSLAYHAKINDLIMTDDEIEEKAAEIYQLRKAGSKVSLVMKSMKAGGEAEKVSGEKIAEEKLAGERGDERRGDVKDDNKGAGNAEADTEQQPDDSFDDEHEDEEGAEKWTEDVNCDLDNMIPEEDSEEPFDVVDKSRCYDWLIVTGTTHYAKDRSSFATYTPLSGVTAGGRPVLGIGSVKLLAAQIDDVHSVSHYYKIEINNVLHMPGMICNGYNAVVADTLCLINGPEEAEGFDRGRNRKWYGRWNRFAGRARMQLRGDPWGKSEVMEREGESEEKLELDVHLTVREMAHLRELGVWEVPLRV